MIRVEQLGPAIDVRAEFVAARTALVQLLRDVPDEAWTAATVCPGWTVRDVAAHLLHDDLRRLSRTRDHYGTRTAPVPPGELVTSLDADNQRWVADSAFASPSVLIDLLDHTGRLVHAMWADADLDAPSEGIWWAGVDVAPIWLDLARDYSEEWTHQQQIRDAVQRPGLADARFLDPVLDTFLRALPHTYREVTAPPGSSVAVVLVDGERTLTWSLSADLTGWSLSRGRRTAPSATVRMPADVLWRLATGATTPNIARTAAVIDGDQELGEPLLRIVSVVR